MVITKDGMFKRTCSAKDGILYVKHESSNTTLSQSDQILTDKTGGGGEIPLTQRSVSFFVLFWTPLIEWEEDLFYSH